MYRKKMLNKLRLLNDRNTILFSFLLIAIDHNSSWVPVGQKAFLLKIFTDVL